MSNPWHPDEVLLLRTELTKKHSYQAEIKIKALLNLAQGMSLPLAAQKASQSEPTLKEWVQIYQEDGLLALLNEASLLQNQATSRALLNQRDQAARFDSLLTQLLQEDTTSQEISQSLRQSLKNITALSDQLRQHANPTPADLTRWKQAVDALWIEQGLQEKLLQMKAQALKSLTENPSLPRPSDFT